MHTFRGILHTRWSLALVTCLLLTLTLPLMPAHAATLTVTKLTDDNTAGTLRNAVTAAMPGDTITFQAGLTGTITLTDKLSITKTVTIQGPGANMLSVKGNGKARVFEVPAGGNLTVDGLTITGGDGGINNGGTVTVTNCTVTGNATTATSTPPDGGGIYNTGTLAVTSSIVTGNKATVEGGGGIFSSGGSATVTASTISGNTATGNGGGIATAGNSTLTVTSSTIAGNTATGFGGGIYADSINTFTLANSTVSGNKAMMSGGGINQAAGMGIARNVTVVNNTTTTGGGGIFVGSLLDIGNSLLTGNTAASGPDFQVAAGVTVTSQGSNFIANDAGTFPKVMSDIVGGTVTVIGPLADNGGPTQTHALLSGSAPVDKGSATLCADPLVGNKDQRGIIRPQGAACDIGAYELQQTGIPMMGMNPAMMPSMNSAMTTMMCAPFAPGSPFAFPAFQTQWQQGEGLTANFWGPSVSGALMEQYQETSGQRLVQYFDKGRMERGVNDVVTNGLLANELITGQMQVGDTAFIARGAANIPVAGDPDNIGPTYAGLGTKGTGLFATTPNRSGNVVTTTVAADGTVTAGATMMGSGPTAISAYDATTQHNVPQAFADYRAKAGLSSIGLAKSEAFLTTVKVGGVAKQVMVQVFERRVLTYTATNDPAFQVEMGNIGQHYYRWRYCGA